MRFFLFAFLFAFVMVLNVSAEDCAAACTFNYDPVCGDNGRTYPNECALDIENCQQGTAIRVTRGGEC